MFFFWSTVLLSTASSSKRKEAEARLRAAAIPFRVRVLETKSDCPVDTAQHAAPQGSSLRRQYILRVPKARLEDAKKALL